LRENNDNFADFTSANVNGDFADFNPRAGEAGMFNALCSLS